MHLQMSQFERIFAQLPESQRSLAQDAVTSLIFMQDQLEKLQAMIDKDGPVIEQINGNGFMMQMEHPAMRVFNNTMKTFNSTCKTLAGLINGVTQGDSDELMTFLKGRRGGAA